VKIKEKTSNKMEKLFLIVPPVAAVNAIRFKSAL
jgi:hypothetical protein